MYVVKRDGHKEPVSFDKITYRIKKLCYGLDDLVDAVKVAMRVIEGLYDGVSTSELDNLAAETAAAMTISHPDYAQLAARIAVSNLHKNTNKSFSETMTDMFHYVNPRTGKKAPLLSDEVYKVIIDNAEKLDSSILYNRDFNYDYFGFKTLERSYLLKINGKIVERPQHMLMRVSIGIHLDDMESVMETYNLMSKKFFTHATPTLFNAGTPKPQMSSCFLLTMKSDSIEGIYNTLKDCALISKYSGGIGLHIHNIRTKNSHIKGTNGKTDGLVPMLRVFNNTARYVNQSGKRNGSFAIYLEPWHADIFDFLELRKNHGDEEMKARDLFYALWISDLFMERVEADADWTLFCPAEIGVELWEMHGQEFRDNYERLEREGKGRRTIKARALWQKVLESQIETGTPYILYKDAANEKSNQKNLGTIKSSNLCTEIMEYTSKDEQAVCNLASIAVNQFIKFPEKRSLKQRRAHAEYDHQALYDVTYQTTLNLNKVIDINFYPTPETKASNMKHRPIGIGIQGLADTFAILGLPFTSDEARKLNEDIFETLYFASMKASADLAKKLGAYESFEGSPLSEGKFQFNLWGTEDSQLSGRWDWTSLRKQVMKTGARNSLLLAPMPTASTAQIMGNNEAFEAFTSNLYTRRTLSGEFVIVNKHLVRDLVELDLWSDNLKNKIITEKGSVQNIAEIPVEIREIYKTVWELKQREVIDMSADRGKFICQSQSLNLFIKDANAAKLTSAHFHSWRKGLKTGMYYLRTESAVDAIAGLGVDSAALKQSTLSTEQIQSDLVCSLDNPDDCIACSS
mgnify:CR=1 FL=1